MKKFLVTSLCFGLLACSPTIASHEQKELSTPSGPLNFTSYEGSLAVIKDKETGCEYVLFFNGYKTGAAISPRYKNSAGTIMC